VSWHSKASLLVDIRFCALTLTGNIISTHVNIFSLCSKFHRIGEKAPEVEGRFGLAEVQLEALMAAANALAEHMAQGRAEAQEIVEAAQAAVPAAAEAGRRKTRGRRKSGWR